MTKAPKQWKLTEDESFSSFTSWQHNLLYTLARDKDFAPFLKSDVTWEKLTATNPTRGFTDDTTGDKTTALQKVANLGQMLGLISQWVPHYLATDITKNSTSMDNIWQCIRKYYGFQQSETQFMKFSSITWEEGERPERLYQRVLAHLQDNLLQKGSKLKHNGVIAEADEDMSPTVERLAVLRWMELIHPNLPALVQRTFAYDLQRMTLKDIQPQIVDALDGFLEELRCEEVKSARAYVTRQKPSQKPKAFQQKKFANKFRHVKECRVCKAEGRPYSGHILAECDYVSRAEKRDLVKSFRVELDNQQFTQEDQVVEELENLSMEDSE
jgi:hypothetical protein